jgi:pyruvate formate lyase activating enzyme
LKGYIFDIKKFSVHDGPGIRTTLFLKGCPLNCVWCHNPEGIQKEPELWYFPNKCMHCSLCVQACPVEALSISEKDEQFRININHELCDSCGLCVEICPTQALLFDGREMDHKDAVNALLEDKSFYDESGGGVTLSGGDPVYQFQYALEILKECKARGVHTAIESALYCPSSVLQKLIPYTDLFICDLKIFDDEKHLEYTGGSNKIILENLKYLSASGKKILVRTPLIPHFSGSDENLKAIGTFLLSLEGRVQYELLNYNSLAMSKYQIRNEKNDSIREAKPFSDAQLKSWQTMLADLGLDMINE